MYRIIYMYIYIFVYTWIFTAFWQILVLCVQVCGRQGIRLIFLESLCDDEDEAKTGKC